MKVGYQMKIKIGEIFATHKQKGLPDQYNTTV